MKMEIFYQKIKNRRMKNSIIRHYEQINDDNLKLIGYQPKMDCSGIWTSGIGHAIIYKGEFLKGAKNRDLAYKLGTLQDIVEVENLLEQDIKPFNLLIARKITRPLNENEHEALLSFLFNCGSSSTLFRLINSYSKDLYDWWCTHYITSDGIKRNGLIYRRHSEALQFRDGIIKFFN